MERDFVTEIESIFREVFGDDSIRINRGTVAGDIEQWDSLTHIEMIVAVEKHFNIQFRSLDLEKLKDVGDLADMVKQKVAV